jgi:hypothetical protein
MHSPSHNARNFIKTLLHVSLNIQHDENVSNESYHIVVFLVVTSCKLVDETDISDERVVSFLTVLILNTL